MVAELFLVTVRCRPS